MALDLDHLHRIHCIGVGGIGVSAVAKFLRLQGKEVTGSDRQVSEVTDDAEKAGVVIKDEDPENIRPDLDLVIHTSAAGPEHPERKAAAALGIPQLSYFEFLGTLSMGYRTIAVAGTNGKSTTTAMLGLMLEAAGLDPTVIVGSRIKKFPYGNLRIGKSDLLVVEACEHESQMRHLSPHALIVTNIAEDHLDFYRDLAHIKETFQGFAETLPEDGLLVINDDDANARELEAHCRRVGYGLRSDADYHGKDITVGDGVQHFTVTRKDPEETWRDMSLRMPGHFNVMNALAASAAARELGADPDAIRSALASFDGLWRRFEKVGETAAGAPVISDYGHHPDAIRGTLAAAREFYPDRRIVLAFQPHHHVRTEKLFDGFVETLKAADVLVLDEIYGVAGRSEAGQVSSEDLARAVREAGHEKIWYAGSDLETRQRLEDLARPGDVILVMGAGSIYRIAHDLVA